MHGKTTIKGIIAFHKTQEISFLAEEILQPPEGSDTQIFITLDMTVIPRTTAGPRVL
jgi:hypothetical protein